MELPELKKASGFRQKVTCALLDCRSDVQQLKVALELLHESNDIIDSLRAEVIRRAEAYDGLVKFLVTIEWIHVAFHEDDYFCPCCKRSKDDGHYKDCRLKQAILEAKQ